MATITQRTKTTLHRCGCRRIYTYRQTQGMYGRGYQAARKAQPMEPPTWAQPGTPATSE